MWYAIYMVGLLVAFPAFLYLTGRARPDKGFWVGLVLFAVPETLWWSMVGETWVFREDIAGTFRPMNLYVGDCLMVLAVYTNAALGIRWLCGRCSR